LIAKIWIKFKLCLYICREA